MCNGNKMLRTSHSITQWVIITTRDGVEKYISRKYGRKHELHYTVLINKAKGFQKEELAKRYMHQNSIEGQVYPVEYSLNIHEKEMSV